VADVGGEGVDGSLVGVEGEGVPASVVEPEVFVEAPAEFSGFAAVALAQVARSPSSAARWARSM